MYLTGFLDLFMRKGTNMYYIEKDNKILFVDENKNKLIATLSFQSNLTEEDIKEVPEGYIIKDFKLMTIEDVKKEEEKAERERLNNLSMTRGDVFEALILAKDLGKAQIRAMIEKAELDTVTKALYLNRFDEALEFYRGYPIFNMLGKQLDITGEMLDKFFETKDYHYLITCKLTIKPIPGNATVTIEPNPTPYGETAHYRVECEGYVAKEGDIEMIKDEVLEIVLDENTTDTEQPTDVSNEMETTATDEPNAN